MQKRAELTSSQIVTLILTIAGFVVALIFLLVFLDTDSLEQRELCKLSVLTRATAPEALQRLAPLKCTTEKVCLSESGGKNCTQFLGVDKKEIQTVKVSTKEDLEKAVADSMYDCWTMMGEGKLDVFGGGVDTGIWSLIDAQNIFQKGTVCVICSRLSVAADISEETLKNVDVNNYLETHQVPKSEKTYLQTFTDQQVRSYPQEFRQNLSGQEQAKPTKEIAVLFMQINTEKNPWEAAGETSIKSASFVFVTTSGVGPLGILSLKPAILLSGATGLITGGIAAFQTWQSRNIAASYCGEFTSIDKARQGCSVVTTFDYNDVASINNYCQFIEGQP